MNKSERLANKNSYAITRGHDFVEIGGVKWATCNLGAENPKDPGLYFMWGDSDGFSVKDVINADWHSRVTSWDGIAFTIRDLEEYDTIPIEMDPARALWGGKWRVPTMDEFRMLSKLRTSRKLKLNKENEYPRGLKFGYENKQIYFPLSGYFYAWEIFEPDKNGYYWTKNTMDEIPELGANAILSQCNSIKIDHYAKYMAYNIRPVLDV